ncbi:hypothetical protein J5N97_020237 [Dioscorea zingiberensis]|uniref:Uncharacterized protein n=1 Tax=Dioscorea zingiberensis TaxID=325984 RepID=A0A9D5CGN9_9LILI|nr:hypothetical protein J5N97_020237 [Dioscorea zingiberensis]
MMHVRISIILLLFGIYIIMLSTQSVDAARRTPEESFDDSSFLAYPLIRRLTLASISGYPFEGRHWPSVADG